MKINILVVEDNSDELFLILRCLSKSDFEVTHLLVDCAQDLTEALDNGNWDVILSDYNIPGFGGAEALQICNSINNSIPFILVSGTIGEETAVSLIKAGAKDYIMKNNLARLPEVIKREIKDAQLLVERNILIEKSNKLSMIVESSPDIVLNFDKNESINYYNKAANELLQLNDYHSDKKLLTEIFSPHWHNFFQSTVLPHLYKFGKWEGELNFKKTDLSELPVLASIVKHSGPEVDEFSIIATNITERKAQDKKTLEFQSKLLSSQLNPHFIFNSLNSIQYYILEQDPKPALDYLSNFATLMRSVMDNSSKAYISLTQEIKFLKTYLELEQNRHRGKFTHTILFSDDIDPDEVLIPPMLLQPFIENTVIHGVGNLIDNGLIEIDFKKIGNLVYCTINDNGVGRKKAIELKSLRNDVSQVTHSTEINNSRLNILNKLEEESYSASIEDLKDENENPLGTKVVVKFPFIIED